MTTLCLISLGCPKNLVDSEIMLGRLRDAGFRLVNDAAEAEVIVVNTCGFIEDARQEAIDTLLDAARMKTEGRCRRLVATGCLVEDHPDELRDALPEVDALLGVHQLDQIARLCDAGHVSENGGAGMDIAAGLPESGFYDYDADTPRVLGTPAHLAYLKIAEGCDNRCTFCTVPRIRGPLRSRSPEHLVEEAEALTRSGVRELVLIAQDTTAYGLDRSGSTGEESGSLVKLLERLNQTPELLWLRLMYAYPERITAPLIRAFRDLPTLCPYFDIPMQHAAPRLLRAMGRGGRADGTFYLELIQRLREEIPDVAVRTSLIVGFPGETETEFLELEQFVESAAFDHLGVFVYSPEPGTPAERLPDRIPAGEAKQRQDRLMQIQQQISSRRNSRLVGEKCLVLVDGRSRETDLLFEGRTGRQAFEIDGCVLINDGECRAGELVEVEVTDAHPYDLVGRVTRREGCE